jgi:predicted exporter
LYSVFGIGLTQEAAGAIDTEIDTALHLAELTISGWSNLWLAREVDINFTELDSGGVTRYRAGAIYRVIMDKSS